MSVMMKIRVMIFKVNLKIFKDSSLAFRVMIQVFKVTIHGVKVIRIFKVINSCPRAVKVTLVIGKGLDLRDIKDSFLEQLVMVSMETAKVRVSMDFKVMTQVSIKWVLDTIACMQTIYSVSTHHSIVDLQ